jgi:hypothetical protein
MEDIKFGTKEYWKNYLTTILKTIEEDTDKLVDIMVDECMSIEINIPIVAQSVPTYEVKYSKLIKEAIK